MEKNYDEILELFKTIKLAKDVNQLIWEANT